MTDNKRELETLEFYTTDAWMIAHAMMIASTRAAMSGRPGASERLAFYRNQLEDLVPENARIFGPDAWSEIGIALAKASRFVLSVHPSATPPNGYWQQGKIVISIEGQVETQEFKSIGSEFKRGAPEVDGVFQMLSDIAPLNCEAINAEDSAENDLKW